MYAVIFTVPPIGKVTIGKTCPKSTPKITLPSRATQKLLARPNTLMEMNAPQIPRIIARRLPYRSENQPQKKFPGIPPSENPAVIHPE